MNNDDKNAIKEICEYINILIPDPPKKEGGDIGTRDGTSDCYNEYYACMARAKSDAQKAACKIRLRKCLENAEIEVHS